MGIINKTRKTTLAKNILVCRSSWSKAKGLMFTNKDYVYKTALVFEFNKPVFQSLHMFFVFYTIDILFLDEKNSVVDMKLGFRPFSIYNSKRRAKYVIELPGSTIMKSKTSLGDVLVW